MPMWEAIVIDVVIFLILHRAWRKTMRKHPPHSQEW